MNGWFENQKQSSSNVRQLLQARIDKANPRRGLTTEELKRLAKLEAMADKLKRGENVQNRQLQTWLSEDEYEQVDIEWQEQLELREELKDKPTELKRYEDKFKEAIMMRNRSGSTYFHATTTATDDIKRHRTNRLHTYSSTATVTKSTRQQRKTLKTRQKHAKSARFEAV